MANHSLPTTASTYANFVAELDGRLDDLALGLDPANTTATNVPTNATRWNSDNSYWEKFNGTVWSAMSPSYSININGTVGATTASTGAFTTLSTSDVASLGANSTVGGVAIVTLSATQTLTSKTLTTPILSATASGTTAGRLGYSAGVLSFGDGTVQQSVATLAGTQTLTNKTLTTPKFADLGFIAGPSGEELLEFDTVGATAANYVALVNSLTTVAVNVAARGTDANISLDLLAKGTGTVRANGVDVVTLSGTQTLTNKTLTTPNLGTTASGTVAGTLGYNTGVLSYGDGTVSQIVVTEARTQTLTNKTLTAPRFADLGFIADASGNELVIFDSNASAVNEVTIANAATTGNPTITATGGDTNISLNLVAKGTGKVLAGGVEVVTLSGSQTLTNKTLTSPVMTGPSLGVATGTSFNSITGLASAVALAAGTAAAGTSTLVARQDHVHPLQTTVSGNAGSATVLQTARAINGVNFDGSQLIRIPNLYESTGLLTFATSAALSSVNYLTATASATGTAVGLSTAGTDTNIGLTITTKGTGAITLDTGTGSGVIDLKPGAGNVRIWDDDSTHYYSFVTGNRTANYTITLPAGNVTLATGTMAVTGGTLGQFAATTSAQLAGVISDETGTGSLVFATSPTLTTPNIGAATGISLDLSSTLIVNSTVAIRAAGNANIELGRIDGVASTPYIDFHSGATLVNYDTRIIASDGNGVDGGGSLDYVANGGHSFTGNITAGLANFTTLQLNGASVTSTAAELNLLDTAAAGTIVNSKAVVYGAAGQVNATTLQIAGTSITSTAAELNKLDGVTSTTAELNLVDGSSSGAVVNSKAVIYGSAGQVVGTTLQVGTMPSSAGPITSYTLTSGGTLYTNGTYTNQIISAGTGTGIYSTWDFTVAGGVVTVATLVGSGTWFSVGATIAIPALGGTGSGGVITVNTVRSVDTTITSDQGGSIRLANTATSTAAGAVIGSLYFNGRDASAKGSGDLAYIQAVNEGTSGGGTLNFWTSANGSMATLAAQLTGVGNFRLYNSAGTFYNEFSNAPTANRVITVPDATGTMMLLHGTANTNGYFYTGTTTPTGNARLNYSGYFYPAYINLVNATDTTTAATHYFVETGSDGFVRPKTLENVKAEILDGSGTTFSTTTTAVSKTLTVGEYCTVTAATQTITLPASPTAGDTVKIGVLAFTDTVIGRNAQNIMSLAENMTIDSQNVTVTLTFVDATRGWRIN